MWLAILAESSCDDDSNLQLPGAYLTSSECGSPGHLTEVEATGILELVIWSFG